MDLCILTKQPLNNEYVAVKLRAKGTVGDSTKQVLNVKMTFKLMANLFTSNAVAFTYNQPKQYCINEEQESANVINRKRLLPSSESKFHFEKDFVS